MTNKIIRASNLGITVEDASLYNIQVDWVELPELIAKLAVAMEVGKKLPPGGFYHPGCIVEEYLDAEYEKSKGVTLEQVSSQQ